MATEYEREVAALDVAIPASNTVDSVNDILLDQLKPRLPGSGTISVLAAADIPANRAFLHGTCDAGMTASTTAIVSANLTGYGNDYFNNSWWMRVVKNANSIGAAPTGEEREITDYVSATGTFTCAAFSVNVEASDEIVIINKNIAGLKYQEYKTGSGNWTVPIGLDFCDVLMVAGGASGGGSSATVGGGGGGGGETVIKKNYLLRGLTTIAYSVGAGGAAPGTDTTGNNGGNTTFGTLTAYGGLGGSKATSDAPFGHGGYRSVNATAVFNQNVSNGGAAGATWQSPNGASTTALSNAGQKGDTIGGSDFVRIGGGGGGFRHASAECPGGQSLSPGGTHTTGNDGNSGGGGGSYGAGANGVSTNVDGIAAEANSGGGGSGGAGLGTARNAGAGGSGYILITWK